MYAIRHKNSGEIISDFPGRVKRYFYGYVILTHEHKVLFFFEIDRNIDHEDITHEYEIINQDNADETQIQNTKNTYMSS
jgi:hypothetical protein